MEKIDLPEFKPKKTQEEIKKEFLNAPPKPKKDVGFIPRLPFYYAIPLFFVIFSILAVALPLIYGLHIIFVIAISILVIPIGFFSLLFIVVRFWIDKNKLAGKIRTWTSDNFLIMNFYLPQKRTRKVIAPIEPDGVSIKLKSSRYMVDYETIWKDERGHPNAYYIPNLPNPLKFNFSRYINEYFQAIKQNVNSVEELSQAVQDIKDWENKPVDVAYSSENLEKYRNDNFFSDMHEKNPDALMKAIAIFAGVLIVAFIAIIVIVAVG